MSVELDGPVPDVASRQAVGTIVANIAEWTSKGAVSVPAETTAARIRVAVPPHPLQSNPTQG